MTAKKIIKPGERFNLLTFVEEVSPIQSKTGLNTRMAKFSCECGNIVVCRISSAVSGNTRSCGCFKLQRIHESKATHGMSQTKIYRRWKGMRERCYNPNHVRFASYGGRGIKICDRWQSFENFYADMGDPISEDASIDRIDNNGDYCPENCKWSTSKEQRVNQRAKKNNSTGIRNIRKLNGKYLAVGWDGKIQKNLGRYNTIEEAIRSRDEFEAIAQNNVREYPAHGKMPDHSSLDKTPDTTTHHP